MRNDHRRRSSAFLIAVVGAATACFTVLGQSDKPPKIANLQGYRNSDGELKTFTTNGVLNLKNPFFQELGTNGRTCASCHLPDQGWTISADKVQERFDLTGGLDPI